MDIIKDNSKVAKDRDSRVELNDTVMQRKKWDNNSVVTPEDMARFDNTIPLGCFMWYYGKTAPSGWVVCDGQEIDSIGRLGGEGEALYKGLGELLFAISGARKLPNMLGNHNFVGYGTGQVGRAEGDIKAGLRPIAARCDKMPEHTHTVNLAHTHTVRSHEHDIPPHRHRLLPMESNKSVGYDPFPFGKDESTRLTYTEKTIGWGNKKERQASFTDYFANITATSFEQKDMPIEIGDNAGDQYDAKENRITTTDSIVVGELHPDYITMLPIIRY